MTRRKPPNMTVPSWVEHQIRTAEAQGAFDNLPGKGKPIPDLDRPQHELSWVANYLRREDVDIAGLLPPGLALAKEIEDLPMRFATLTSEARARAYLVDLNARILDASRRTLSGPPVRVVPVDVDVQLDRWRVVREEVAAQRAEAAASRAEAAAEARAALAADTAASRRRRWWRRGPSGV